MIDLAAWPAVCGPTAIGWIARLRDDRFRVPGTSIRFGLDGLLGLVPGIGDGATALVSLYIVARAWSIGVPKGVLGRMLANVLVDSVVGSIPLLGDIFDVAFKSKIGRAHV